MGDSSDSMDSDDSSPKTMVLGCGDFHSNFVIVPEMENIPPILPTQNWLLEMKKVLEDNKTAPDAIEWILTNFYTWDHLNQLQSCEDLTPKQIRILTTLLEEPFALYSADKKSLLTLLQSDKLLLNQTLLSTILKPFVNGNEVFQDFLCSERLMTVARAVNAQKIRKLLATSITSNTSEHQLGAQNLEPMQKVEQILKSLELNEVARNEILDKLALFDNLKTCLENCDEITKKQQNILTDKLEVVFSELKNSSGDLKIDPEVVVESVTQGLQLSLEATAWILKWLSGVEIVRPNVSDIENCEDLTKRQSTILKKRLSQFFEEGQNIDKKQELIDPRQKFIEELSKILIANDINGSVQKWLLEMAPNFESLDSLNECEDLTKKQVRTLIAVLQEPFETYNRSTKQTEASCADFLEETEKKVCEIVDSRETKMSREVAGSSDEPDVEIMEIDGSDPELSLTPLILFHTEMQENFSIEKFSLCEEGVKYICHLVPESETDETPVLYTSISGTPVINFATLDHLNFDCVGLFGPFKAVLRNLLDYIPGSKLQDLENSFQLQKSGLYLLEISNNRKKFLLFYSEKDADFASVKKDSRAVHFLRYMSQLTNNVVMCLDENYQDRLANKGEKIEVKSDRRSKYNLKKHELQQESFTVKNLGFLPNSSFSVSRFFSSENGLIAAKFEKVAAKEKVKPTKKTGDVNEVAKLLDSMSLKDVSRVCDEFKIEYLKKYSSKEFKEVESEVSSEVETIRLESESKAKENVLISAAIHFVNDCGLKVSFKVVEKYFKSNPIESGDLWKNRIVFNLSSINGPISTSDEITLKKQIEESKHKGKTALDKFLLWKALSDSAEGLPEGLLAKGFADATWKDLKECAKERFGSYVPYRTQSKIESEMENAEKKLNYSEASELLKTCIDTFLDHICSLVKPYSDKSKFVQYCRKHVSDEFDKIKKQKLDSRVQQLFDEVYLKKKEKLLNDVQTPALIQEIQISKSYSIVTKYDCLYEKTTLDPAKTKIEINRLAASREEHQRLSITEGTLNVRELEFLKTATVEIPDSEELLKAFPLEHNHLLLVCNFEKVSKTIVYNLSNVDKPVLDMAFGKNVSSASFDCKARVLAVQSDSDPGIVQLFKFGEDFKSRQSLKPVDLNRMFGIEKTVEMCLQPNSKFFWFASDGRLRKMDYKNGAMIKAVKLEDTGDETTLKSSADGSCILAIWNDDEVWPVMTETGNKLDKVEGVSKDTAVFSLCNQILAVRSMSSSICIQQIVVTGAQHETKLSKSMSERRKTENSASDLVINEEHWINYIYWLYTKFPSDDLLATKQAVVNFWITIPIYEINTRSKILHEVNCILGKIQKTRKPTNYLSVQDDHIEDSVSKIKTMEITGTPMGSFLKRLITFVPIQIARCQSNEFSILENGQTVSLDSVNVAFDLMEKINLGFYESIFNAWNGNIKVISSMGKQTTGKSYTLNHLTGSSFNIAGTRCTDGCWMTVKEHEDCLYVILDFEGLGSFERTEQDDMLLSLFNSAISTTTIFKTEKRLDRDVDKMFNKINMGSDQLKGNDKVFKGKFIIVINDVAEQDVKDTPKEFEEKISNIVSRSENNFIKKLYNSDFEIMAFPAFESRDYYESTANLLSIVQEEIEPVFTSGPEFLGTVKLLMAKLAINDFSPLDRQQIDERVRFIRSILPFAIHFGQISEDNPKKKELDLRSFDDSTFRISLQKEIVLNSIGTVTLNDFETIFKENQLDDSVMQFLAISEPNAENFHDWREGLQSFVSEAIQFRFERVKQWLEANLQKWKLSENAEYDDIINVVMENLENQKACFEQTYKFCDEKCSECFLKCTQIVNHKGDHKCSTSHCCTAQCEYCENDMNKCKVPFGHEGKHVCREINHVCSEPCKFNEVNSCEGECQKMTGHKDDHECSEKRHPCKETCTLDGCEGRCIIDCDIEHSVHKCTKEQCISKCCVTTCTNKCAALDHFHGTSLSGKFKEEQCIADEFAFLLEDKQTRFDCEDHFCGKEHQCDKDCEHDGFCHVWTEKQLKDETFEGKRDTFTYSVKFAEMGEKLLCRQKLKPFTRMHEGGHSCSTEVHFCMTTCPTCENICNKAVNHESDGDVLHHARHGNMRKCFFVANEDDIQVGTHKYKVGEPAVAEMCHIFCNSLGRGHIHIVECDSEDPTACVYSAKDDRRRHESTRYQPNPEIPKDEITHEAYWASIGFQDPCQEIDSENFEKCPAYCAAEVHEKEDEQPFCEMPIWHNPVKSLAEVCRTSGFLTKDGHVFPCSHPSGIYHFVLCLDDSGSMRGSPWTELVSAVNAFVAQRKASSSSDMISIAIHNHKTRITAEYQPITSFASNWLTFHSGENDFSQALSISDGIIGRHLDKNIKPVLVFMSDGIWHNGEVEMEELARKYRVANGLEVYTVGFGSVSFEKLRELARLGKGQYLEAVNGMELKTAFVEISAKHPATIGVSF